MGRPPRVVRSRLGDHAQRDAARRRGPDLPMTPDSQDGNRASLHFRRLGGFRLASPSPGLAGGSLRPSPTWRPMVRMGLIGPDGGFGPGPGPAEGSSPPAP